MNLTDQIAQLWTADVATVATPTVQARTKLPELPKPLGCELDHHDQGNWLYSPDCYGRVGFRRVACKSCGRFWGYDVEPSKPKKPKR